VIRRLLVAAAALAILAGCSKEDAQVSRGAR
jgi:hypothetical protein